MLIPNPYLRNILKQGPKSNEKPTWYNGRWRRASYAVTQLLVFVPLVILIIYLMQSSKPSEPAGSAIVYIALMAKPIFIAVASLFPILIIQFFATAGRLRDINSDPNLAFLFFVPVIGFLQVIYLLFASGSLGPNKYGEDPRKRAPFDRNPGVTILDDELSMILKDQEQKIETNTISKNESHAVYIGFDKSISRFYMSILNINNTDSAIDKQFFLNISMLRAALKEQTNLKPENFVVR